MNSSENGVEWERNLKVLRFHLYFFAVKVKLALNGSSVTYGVEPGTVLRNNHWATGWVRWLVGKGIGR